MCKRTILFLSFVVLILPLLPSCRAEPLAPEEPIATLLAPSNGESLKAGPVQVRIYIQNFSMAESKGQSNKAGQGHAIYYLDVSAPLGSGNPATTSPGSFVSSAKTAYTWQNVPPGQHTFTVQLVNNDNTPLIPPVAVRANVNLTSR